jgi:cell fate (sporulation/competence/biofilm development) regulator YlbF (YheA/YmcA/DUF963 family)
MTDIIMQAYQVLDELKIDTNYLLMKSLDKEISSRYPKEIEAFQKAKKIYEDVLETGGTYHPDYKEAVKKLSLTKAELYQKAEVKKYLEAEKSFQDMINTFLNEMTQSVSSHIKTPNKLGIVQKGGSCHVR